MRVLVLSTFDRLGGASVAANRLVVALRNEGIEVRFGVVVKQLHNGLSLEMLGKGKWRQLSFWLRFVWERLAVRLILREKGNLYKFSLGSLGVKLDTHPEVLAADVIHVHWVNFGLLSVEGIVRLSQQKPIVWTFHDQWIFTGGCHLPFHCMEFQTGCHSCFYLKRSFSEVAKRNLTSKKLHLDGFQGQLVTVSSWMKARAAESRLLCNKDVHVIGNALDVGVFSPRQSLRGREIGIPEGRFILLAGAADFADKNKGFQYLQVLLGQLDEHYAVVFFGDSSAEMISDTKAYVHFLGKINTENEMAAVYSMAHCFLLPSIQESLSYTAMEAMACGTPVICFRAGGVLDLVRHKETGLIASEFSGKALYDQVSWLRENESDRLQMARQARQYVVSRYSEPVVASKYLRLYQRIIHRTGDIG